MAKINEIHKPLYTSKKRYKYEKGGRGSGKSFVVTDYCLRMTYDNGRVILFMRYTMIAAAISIVPEFMAAMDRENATEDFKVTGNEIINKHTGSRIVFKGVKTSSLNQTANLKSIQGLTDVIYDEFEEHPDQDSFDKLDESIREVTAANNIVLVSNALHKKSWQFKQFWQPDGLYYSMTEHILSTWEDNAENLSESWHQKREIVKEKDPVKYARDYDGKDYDDIVGALWTQQMINDNRVTEHPELTRIVVAIDPATTSKDDSDETGIIAAGLGVDGFGYILHDVSGKYTPDGWANKSIIVYDKLKADRIVGEANNGGDMIETVIRHSDPNVSYKKVWASRGKVTRAEPVVALYEQNRIKHVGVLPELEDEMTTWDAQSGAKSPNRIDAMVWAITDLMLKKEFELYVG